MSFAERLAALRRDVDAELLACGRPAGSVAILGVSKKQPAEALAEAAAAGLYDLGENYAQEGAEKAATLGWTVPAVRQAHDDTGVAHNETGVAHADTGVAHDDTGVAGTCHPELVEGAPCRPRLHFIGHVQTNKAKRIVEAFDVVQTVDRADAAKALARAAEQAGRTLSVLIQLNISPAERFGCPPGEAEALAETIRGYASLRLDGVMAIGPITQNRQEIAAAFALAAKTFEAVGGSTLSIGMSGDWRDAVRAGSTMIRIGTALFGERPRH